MIFLTMSIPKLTIEPFLRNSDHYVSNHFIDLGQGAWILSLTQTIIFLHSAKMKAINFFSNMLETFILFQF